MGIIRPSSDDYDKLCTFLLDLTFSGDLFDIALLRAILHRNPPHKIHEDYIVALLRLTYSQRIKIGQTYSNYVELAYLELNKRGINAKLELSGLA